VKTWAARAATALGASVAALAVHDLRQRRHAITRNFPVVGHLRFWLEAIGPELRQYIVTDNDQERPFNRDQRRWIYTTSKAENNLSGFGSDDNLELASGYVIIKHVAFPRPQSPPGTPVPGAKVIGAAHGRAKAFRPASVVNVSAMSFGSLSGPAVEALNRGAAEAGCLHNTGEGGISTHHRHGSELIWQIGTGYFGCRDEDGAFSLEQAVDQAASAPVRAIEIKLSQGAKAGLGGVVPGVKVTPEIAAMRGVPVGQACISPPYHRAFTGVDGLIDFVETLAGATGLPVGIKSAVGEQAFWDDLVARMAARGEGPDFVTVDGGEGGSGAAPFVFADHVGLPFRVGFPRVYRAFAAQGLTDDICFIGSGKLGLPDTALLAMGLGCDLVNVGREAMLSIGCIQAQRCHTGRCPTGVATQSPWLMGGLDPALKYVRAAAYIVALRSELSRLAGVCGQPHPAFVDLDDFELVDHGRASTPARVAFAYEPGWGVPGPTVRADLLSVLAEEPDHVP
jgi:glutamate synthase domain-containing protein 2